jgi:hypothetical protein
MINGRNRRGVRNCGLASRATRCRAHGVPLAEVLARSRLSNALHRSDGKGVASRNGFLRTLNDIRNGRFEGLGLNQPFRRMRLADACSQSEAQSTCRVASEFSG